MVIWPVASLVYVPPKPKLCMALSTAVLDLNLNSESLIPDVSPEAPLIKGPPGKFANTPNIFSSGFSKSGTIFSVSFSSPNIADGTSPSLITGPPNNKFLAVSNLPLFIWLPKYKSDKGRAFSYFSVVGKNYLILNNNNNYKKMKIHDDIKRLDYKRNVFSETMVDETAEYNSEFVTQMLNYWDNNITNIFRRQKDILVADAVLELFRKRKNIENFNKKALYIMIREMTGSNTQHITRVVNQMKKYYFNMMSEFSTSGQIDTSNTGSIF